MLFIFLIEDQPIWVILMISKLDFYFRVAESLLSTHVSSRR